MAEVLGNLRYPINKLENLDNTHNLKIKNHSKLAKSILPNKKIYKAYSENQSFSKKTKTN